MNESMDHNKKAGIYLIIAGILIPLALLPFVSGYSLDKGFLTNLVSIGIVLRDPQSALGMDKNASLLARLTPRRIPYRFILAFGVVLVFAGYMKMEISRNNKGPQH